MCKAQVPSASFTCQQGCKQRAEDTCLSTGHEKVGAGLVIAPQSPPSAAPGWSVPRALPPAGSKDPRLMCWGSLTCASSDPAPLWFSAHSASGHGHFRLYCSLEPLHWLITSSCWPDFLYTQSGPQCRDIPIVATFCGSIWTAQLLNFSNFYCCFCDQSTIFFLFDLSQEWCQ